MRASRYLKILVAGCGALAAAASSAQSDIPAALAPWRAWVLHGEEYRGCPVLNGYMPGQRDAHVCAWPGELAIDVSAGGAQFSQRWDVSAQAWLPLPGDAERWPTQVNLDGNAAAAVERDGRPALRVSAGTHTVTGVLSWQQRPASVPIPSETGLVSLRLDGAPVARPEIDAGTLWLGLVPEAAVEADRLSVAVYRLLSDDLPIRTVTEVQLDVAGQSREIELSGALLPGFVGERLDSALPAELDADGTLRVQVRPGDWTLRLASHATGFVANIGVPTASEPWPAEEIWSYAADNRLRVAVLEGAPAVDALATGVPADWRSLPSYRVAAGTTLALTQRSRNDADEPNRLTLGRELWLDFAGKGFTALDTVSGEVHSGWRLDMAAPYTMTMATFDLDNPTAENSLLVTNEGAPGVRGVELRRNQLDLRTVARIESLGAVPVTGYLDAFDSVRTTLHLPPGHRLLAALGTDAVYGAWLNDWRLLDLFLALIVAAATWRLVGAGAGALAAVTMLLIIHEPAAPQWLWLNLLVAIGLLRVAPEGRLRRMAALYRSLSLAALALLLIPFTVTELRALVYPQLERPALERGLARETAGFSAPLPEAMKDIPQSLASGGVDASRRTLEQVVATARREEPPPELARYLPGALVQTGPGIPDWDWTRATLSWASPVEPGQRYRLVILGRWGTAAWRLASVLGAFALLWLLVRPVLRLPPGWLRGSASAAAVLLAMLLATPEPARAQAASDFPSPTLLEQLKQRLTEPAPCRPSCTELTSADARVAADTLTIELEFANQAAVAVPLPGGARGWRADAVAVDGTAARELYVNNARYWLPLEAGVHRVRLRGLLPAANSVTIPFPLTPRRVTVDAPGWDVTGLAQTRLLSGALELVRQQQGEAGEALGTTEFPPFVRIEREIELGLEWIVHTSIERVAPSDAAFTVPVALLPGEAVITPGVEIAGAVATAAFAADQPTVAWESRLPVAPTLVLAAGTETSAAEHWVFRMGPLWHAEFAGLPRSPTEVGGFALEYLPRPGETLRVAITQPEPSGGDTIAIDSADYTASVGQRLTQSTLTFDYRSTRAEQHVVSLPAGSTLDRVAIDGRPVALRLDGERLELPVTTGQHSVEVVWRNAGEIGTVERVERVDLGAGATNLQAALSLPRDRWVLWSFGPPLGPAILYWSELLVFGLAAVGLGRLAWSPLRTHEWLLLGLGLSTFAWPTLLLFAFWAFAMSWRSRSKLGLGDRAFNALQLGLGLLSAAALLAVIGAIPLGLLGTPDMQIVSPVGGQPLSWFEDRSTGLTPSAGALSVSLWFYRAAMLAWALWLSFALLRWLPWAWCAFSHGGLWRGKIKAAAEREPRVRFGLCRRS